MDGYSTSDRTENARTANRRWAKRGRSMNCLAVMAFSDLISAVSYSRSAKMACAMAAGSAASRIGRPTTMASAPWRRASAGVATRF